MIPVRVDALADPLLMTPMLEPWLHNNKVLAKAETENELDQLLYIRIIQS
jgi:hypothetical protein